ncbi:MAG: amidohydrolase/deacetylase family metallohydrolase, partial [Pseudomonadota bacterium]|nr:amidohydrolase/deacetylase family metallohydrolase [Pseudomonadota bacterium]
MLGMGSEIGSLMPGMGADISVLNIENGNWTFVDNSHVEVPTEKLLTPAFCLRDGEMFDANSPLLPQPDLIAA